MQASFYLLRKISAAEKAMVALMRMVVPHPVII